ncbi:WD40 repeat-like protein [Suhomyces tanzawaensis NRRL Y-17324]|uniref:WD40 repeat-like protein n=1 Tax=Suhomyces tanzawaensis NRRL Y-17324 TaxID=984487 RepID=A0A1E4SPY8_9ASCO|nr:WD40 repeat-like protein [Suhomyces tanzawaensis NRRL Y-17324]ODV81497.1 WD40 repeat-like protein [Suhomyces tanzawaensis NRRL Y-17324]
MKIKTISRSSDAYVPVRNTQESALPRNLNPALHPFERAREYTKALTATKMERMFAQPFVGQLGDGHRDGVYSIAKNFSTTNQVASGSGDGVIKYWSLTSRQETISFKAHYGMVSGLVVTPDASHMLSCGDDKTVKLWSVNTDKFNHNITDEQIYETKDSGLVKTFLGEHAFKGIDHHREEETFVTGGAAIQLWDMNRTRYISNLTWGADNVNTVKFNKTETNIIASAGSDNSIVLYDIRTNSPIQKVVTSLRTNALAWNPMEAFHFVSGGEDHNAYLWDMRNLNKSFNVYKDHVAPIMDVDFSPTGEEVVTGGYDKTIRIFRARDGHSRDIYHTKRMQRVFSVKFTTDARYILSGSDDTNIRLWRTNASDRAGVKSTRQRNKMEYDAALKERYKHMPEIKRISRHRHLPSTVKKAKEIKATEMESMKKREQNDRRHSKPGTKKVVPDREKHIRGTALKDE